MRSIEVTPEIEALINQQVETGKYKDALAVIAEGLHLIAEREQIYKGRFEELKREVMIGYQQLQQGEGIEGEQAMKALRNEMVQRFDR